MPSGIGIVASARVATAPPAGPLLLDSFTRANGAVGNLDTGQTWLPEAGSTWSVLGNSLQFTSGSNKGLHVNIGATSMRVQASRLSPTAVFADLIASASGFSDYYRFQIDSGNVNLYVGRVIAGVNTWLWNGPAPSGLFTGTFELKIQHSGGATQVTATANGTQVYTTSDTGVGRPVGTYGGFRQFNSGGASSWANFEGQSL